MVVGTGSQSSNLVVEYNSMTEGLNILILVAFCAISYALFALKGHAGEDSLYKVKGGFLVALLVLAIIATLHTVYRAYQMWTISYQYALATNCSRVSSA